MQVQRGNDSTETWQILKRYNDFVQLHKSLSCSEQCPELPRKKFIGNMHPAFIAQRRFELQEYLKTVLMNPILASSLTTKKFIDPEQYMQPFHGKFCPFLSFCMEINVFFSQIWLYKMHQCACELTANLLLASLWVP